MLKKMNVLALCAVLFGVSAIAAAQTPHKPVGLSLRAGLFLPTDSATRRVNSTWFGAGVDYKIHERMLQDAHRDTFSVSLDYTSKGNFRSVPLLVNMTRNMGDVYVTGGVGVSFTRRPVFGGTEDKARFAYTLGLGHDFNTSQFPLFVEGRFFGNERPELNGFAIYVGARF